MTDQPTTADYAADDAYRNRGALERLTARVAALEEHAGITAPTGPRLTDDDFEDPPTLGQLEAAATEAEKIRQRDAARALSLQRFTTHVWNTNVTWPCERCGATQPQGWMGACGDPIVDPPLTFEGGTLEGMRREDEVTVELTHGEG